MNRFLLKNDTTENVSARVTVSPSDELGNLGHDAATVIEGDRLTTCLAPTAVALPEPTGFRSQCFELNDNGRYAVEINGVVQPYAFTPADLLDCFNGQHESSVRFLECSENACLNATPTCDTGGIWEPFNIFVNGVEYPDGFGNEKLREMFDLEYDGELHCIFTNKTKDYLKISFTEIYLNVHDHGWRLNKNPTLKYSGEDRTLDFCLAPAEPKPSISCDGATNQVSLYHTLPWVGESGAIITIYNDDTGEEVINIQGYYLNYPDYDMSKLINPNVDYVTAIPYSDSLTTEYDNYRTTTQGVSYRNTSSEPLRLRIEVNNYGGGSDAWNGFVNPETEFHHNPTFNTIYESSEKTIHVVCLAPLSKPEISCEGATTEAYIAFNGWDSAEYDVEINGVTARVVVTTPSDIVSAYLESVPDANLEGLYASGGSSSTHTLYNTNETTDYRIRIMPISSENLTEEELIAKFNGNVWENPSQNPTFGYDTTTGEITFCLAHVVDDGMVDAEASGLQVLWTKTLTAGDEYGLTYSLDDGATQEQVTWTVPEGEMYLSHAYYNLFKQIPLVKSEDTPAGTQYAFTVELSPHSLAFDLNGNSRVYPDSTPVKVTVYPKPHATNAAYDKSLYDDYPDATIGTFISGGLLTS